MNAAVLSLECYRCQTRYPVSHPKSLRPRKKSKCQTCGMAFITVALPENPELQSDPSLPSRRQKDGISSDSLLQDYLPNLNVHRFAFHGVGGTLIGIQIVNVFLTLLTLGMYHFWAKVRVRKYVISQTECAGDRLAYEGRGKELLIGFLRASVFFGIPYFLLALVPDFFELSSWAQALTQWMAGGVIFLFIPIAVVSARRYRLSRTSWRGIRFSFRGRAWDFLKLYAKGMLFSILTLGVYYPYYQTQRQAFLVCHSYLGNQRFGFVGQGSALLSSFAMTLVLTVLTAILALNLPHPTFSREWNLYFLGVLWPFLLIILIVGPLWVWFAAKKYQYFWNQTTLGTARFRSTVTGRPLLNLQVENLLLLVCTLGFAWPWVVVRTQRFYADRLTLEGFVDLDEIQQEYEYVNPIGEGLANILDTGFEMD